MPVDTLPHDHPARKARVAHNQRMMNKEGLITDFANTRRARVASVTLSDAVKAGLKSVSPPDNMGVTKNFNEKTEFSIDWLSVTVWAKADRVIELIKYMNEQYEHLLLDLEESKSAGSGYRRLYIAANNFRLYFEPVNVTDAVHCSVQFSGQTCKAWGIDNMLDMLKMLSNNNIPWAVSRFDTAFDHQEFHTEDFAWLCKNAWDERIKTRVHKKSFRQIEEPHANGYTAYLGSRESEAFLRVYNKHVEGHERFGDEYFTRCEMVYKGDKARALFPELVALPLDQWAGAAGQFLAGFVQVETTWWDEWIGAIGSAWFSVKRAVKTLEKTLRWLDRGVSKSLAVAAAVMAPGYADGAGQWLLELFANGFSKLEARDLKTIQVYQAQVAAGMDEKLLKHMASVKF